MTLVGEVRPSRWYFQQLWRREELEALRHIETVIELSVNDQCGRLELRRKLVWRPLLVTGWVAPRSALEFPRVKPQLFGGAEGGHGVEHAVVRHHALESCGVAEQP